VLIIDYLSVVSICLQLVSSNCDLSNDAGGFPIVVTEIWIILWIRIDWGIRCCILKVENDVERIQIETSIQLPLTHKSPNGTHFRMILKEYELKRQFSFLSLIKAQTEHIFA